MAFVRLLRHRRKGDCTIGFIKQMTVDIVTGRLTDRTIATQERRTDNSSDHRQLPAPLTMQISLGNFLGSISRNELARALVELNKLRGTTQNLNQIRLRYRNKLPHLRFAITAGLERLIQYWTYNKATTLIDFTFKQ